MSPSENTVKFPDAETVGRIFNFAQEVKKALKDYPQLRLKTIFANASAEKLTMAGHWLARMKATIGGYKSDRLKRQVDQSRKDDTSLAFSLLPDHGLQSVIMNENDGFVRQMGITPEKKEQARSFALDHEMGHLLVSGGTDRDDHHPFSENAADSFGALRHLQRFDNDTSLLKAISWNRSFMFVASGNSSHLTTASLDSLSAKADTTDFTKLDAAQTVTLAEVHAKTHTPARQDFDQAKENLAGFAGKNNLYPLTQQNAWKLASLAETILSTSHRFTFQIGFRVIAPFLNPQGAIVNGESVTLDSDRASRYVKALAEKAKELSLDDIVQELTDNKSDITSAKTTNPQTPRPTATTRKAPAVLNVF